LFDQAVEILIETGRGSVSLLQRRMSIGYSRASRLVDQMGKAGILSDHKGSVAREVLITAEEWEEMKAMQEGEGGQELTYEEDPDGLDGVPDEYENEFAS
jgi:S-DNA-T family DNA segregation ATPase FtsK/SpoIIIE